MAKEPRGKVNGNGSGSLKEYAQGQAFSGVIGRTFVVSQPAWQSPARR